MDLFEQTLTDVIERFVALQNWSAKPEAVRRPAKMFPVIIGLDCGLKYLRQADKAHPLQELAREVRTSFDTREFRAILLAAFNWRSASKPPPKATKPPPKPTKPPPKPTKPPPKPTKQKQPPVLPPHPRPGHRTRLTQTSGKLDRPSPPRQTPEQVARDAANSEKFFRDCMAFLASIPADTHRRIRAPEGDYKDIYDAGRRLNGSFGATQ